MMNTFNKIFRASENYLLVIVLLFIFSNNINSMQTDPTENDSLLSDLSESKLANELYNNGMKQYKAGNIDSAIEYLEKATDIDKNFAQAYDLLALAYIEHETVYSRTLAERAIKKAILLNREELLFKLHHGKLMMRQGFRYNAKKRFEWLKKVDSTNTEIYLNLGLLYMNEMEYYKNMVSGNYEDGSILSFIDPNMLNYIFNYQGSEQVKNILSEKNESVGKYTDFGEFVQKEYTNAVIAFSDILKIEPNNKDALHNLSLLSMEVGKFDKFVDYQKKIIENYPDDKDAHLFLGFGHHLQKNDELAYIEYENAKTLMSSDEKAVFEAIEYIVPSDDIKEYQNLASADKSDFEKVFWKQKDPLFLSEYNERVIEHYSRVAYANLKFEVKKKKIPGWKTDRGKIYIRYGVPLEIVRLRPERGTTGKDDLDLTEIWYYDGFSFAFSDEYRSGDFKLGARTRFPGVHYPEIAEAVYKEKPEIYTPRFQGSKFDFGYYVASFRGNNGKSLVEVSYALPVNIFSPKKEKNYMATTVKGGIFFFDDKWNEAEKLVTKEKIILNPQLDSEKNYYIIGMYQLEIEPGEYNFAVEFQEEESKNTGAYRNKLKVDAYPIGELKLSDILLASNIINETKDPKYTKNGKMVIPNPARLLHKNQLMHIYFETYDLMVNPEQKTKFLVEYKITSKSSDNQPVIKRIFSSLGEFIGLNEGKQEITASYEYEGIEPTEKINLSIDMSATRFGLYELSVTVEDLISNKKASKSIQFGIQDAIINYLF